MSQDVAARLVALSQDHREGRLTVSAYRALRAPLLDMLVTPESLVGAEEVDPSTTTLPRHRTPAVGAANSATGSEPTGLLAPEDSLAEASALARTNLRAAAQAERSPPLRSIVLGSVFLAAVVGLIAAWVAWSPPREAAPYTAKTALLPGVESATASPAPTRPLTPMPPPLPKEAKRKSAAPAPPPITAQEPGPRMLAVAGLTPDSVAFAISARPVSQAQFRMFCQRMSRPYPRQPWEEEDDPVVNVTWDEARDYLAWLSSITGKRYRLATEMEWLYFVRQGAVDARWRNGNVREWLQDAASDSADEGAADAVEVVRTTAFDPAGDTPHQRVVRGVSYADAATDLLSARRSQDASIRDALTGFRALRESH